MKTVLLIMLGIVFGTSIFFIPEFVSSHHYPSDMETALEYCLSPGDHFAHGTMMQNSTHYFDDSIDCFIFDNRMIKGSGDTSAEERVYENFPDFLKPPLKQITSGIPVGEIRCKDDLVLIQKYDGSPACVSLYNTHKLFDRGWINSSNISQFKEIFCDLNDGKWSKEFHNCVGGSIQVSCDDVGASELKPPNVFGRTITQEGQCISHEKMCSSMGGKSECMSDEQKGYGRDVCIAVCEFGN